MPRGRLRREVNEAALGSLLCENLDAIALGLFSGTFKNRLEREVIDNLNPKRPLRDYQREAIGRLDFYLNEYQARRDPVNVLFHMATGSGKTLIMAANVLALFRRGYRNFIFFVNSTTTIDNTKAVFTNPNHPKYLFADPISVDGRIVRIREVENFDAANSDDINVIFTTIQGLHTQLNTPRENSLTYHDLTDRDVVLISDETHHLNALTRVRGSEPTVVTSETNGIAGMDASELNEGEKESLQSWEGTVRRIFLQNPRNVLLEYTATIELQNPNIREKYREKILYQYDLRHFRRDGYSKEIDVVQADIVDPMDRALRAIVVSQYKRKVAQSHGILLKPVILFKANRISVEGRRVTPQDVGSHEFQEQFARRIERLDGPSLKELRDSLGDENNIVQRAFGYFKEKKISLDNLADELRIDFSREHLLSANDDADLLSVKANTLEDPDNEIRAVFAVAKLTEGWDVLNLFDIVRLYNTRDARHNQPGKTTMSEAQLIGRGARYFPFSLSPDQDMDRRKYDDQTDNELREIETLHYHSARNPEYIQELKQALVQVGIDLTTTKTCSVRVKDTFKKTEFYKTGVVFINERKKRDVASINALGDTIRDMTFRPYELQSGEIRETEILGRGDMGAFTERKSEERPVSDFRPSTIRKALDRHPFYHFSNLRRFFPNLVSMEEFISNKAYLAGLHPEIRGSRYALEHLSADDGVAIIYQLLEELRVAIEKGWTEYCGTKEFTAVRLRDILRDRDLQIAVDASSDQERGLPMSHPNNDIYEMNLREEPWYIFDENYGTSEEKSLVKYISVVVKRLEEKYSDIYLLRNEKDVKLYRFSDGKATEPDFLFFLAEKITGRKMLYQLFIESKGGHLLEHDQWKEEFLLSIEGEAKTEHIHEDAKIKIIGLPFYTSAPGHQPDFKATFREKLGLI